MENHDHPTPVDTESDGAPQGQSIDAAQSASVTPAQQPSSTDPYTDSQAGREQAPVQGAVQGSVQEPVSPAQMPGGQASVIMDSATGQMYYAIPQGQPVQQAPAPQNNTAAVAAEPQNTDPRTDAQAQAGREQAPVQGSVQGSVQEPVSPAQMPGGQASVIMDPATGQMYYAIPQGQPVQQAFAPQNDTAAVAPEPQNTDPRTDAQAQAGREQAPVQGSVQGSVQEPVSPAQMPGGQASVIMDPATGQLYSTIPQGQPVQPLPQNNGYVYYTTQPPLTAQMPSEPSQAPSAAGPDAAQILKSVEDFAQGDATVADVVKTFYTQTSQDDQFWKGAVIGAAAGVLLNSTAVRAAMGSTFGSLFGKHAQDTAGTADAAGAASGIDSDKK